MKTWLLAIGIALSALIFAPEPVHAASVWFITPTDGAIVQRGSAVTIQIQTDVEWPYAVGFNRVPLRDCTNDMTTTPITHSCIWDVPNRPNATYVIDAVIVSNGVDVATQAVTVKSSKGK